MVAHRKAQPRPRRLQLLFFHPQQCFTWIVFLAAWKGLWIIWCQTFSFKLVVRENKYYFKKHTSLNLFALLPALGYIFTSASFMSKVITLTMRQKRLFNYLFLFTLSVAAYVVCLALSILQYTTVMWCCSDDVISH